MTTVGEAFAALGYTLTDDETVCVAQLPPGGKIRERHLREVADQKIGVNRYVSSGTFPADTVWGDKARTGERVQRILFLPFDFDLKDFLNCEKSDLADLDDATLDALIGDLRAQVEEIFQKITLPIHRLDFTGYGVAVQVRLIDHDATLVPQIRQYHKQIVERINAIWRGELADRQVSDAGSRIMRLIPCENVYVNDKTGVIGPARQTRNLSTRDGSCDLAMLEVAAGPLRSGGTRPAPVTGKSMPDADAQAIVDAIAPFWTDGRRHFMGLYVTGWLAKSHVSEEQALAIVQALSAGDSKPWDREKAVRDTYNRYRNGFDVKGYAALREYLDAEALDAIGDRLDRVRNATSARLIVKDKPREKQSAAKAAAMSFTEPPERGFRGWLGSYVELMQPTTEAPAAFHLGVGFTIAGAILGRDVWSDYGEPTHANLFTLLVGKSGKTRKDTAIRRGTRMITDQHIVQGKLVNQLSRVITDIGSAEGLMSELSSYPNLILYSTEFSKLMGNAKRKATGTIIPTLMQAWDAPIVMSTLTRGDPIEAHFPYLSVIAATQPEILATLMSDDDVFSGFANRWFYICGEPTNVPIPSPPSVDPVMAADLYGELKARRAEGASRSGGFRLTESAREAWDAWYVKDYHRESETQAQEAMRPRHAPLIRKLALIYAATEGSAWITADHITAAIEVIEWMWSNVSRLVGTWGETTMAKLERRIIEVLAEQPNRAMSRRDLQRKCQYRAWTGKDFASMLDAMATNGTVIIDAAKTVQLVADVEGDDAQRAG